MTTLYTNIYMQTAKTESAPQWMKSERFDYCEKLTKKRSFFFNKKSR